MYTKSDFTCLTTEIKSTCFAKISNTVLWVERERNTQQVFIPINKPFLTQTALQMPSTHAINNALSGPWAQRWPLYVYKIYKNL